MGAEESLVTEFHPLATTAPCHLIKIMCKVIEKRPIGQIGYLNNSSCISYIKLFLNLHYVCEDACKPMSQIVVLHFLKRKFLNTVHIFLFKLRTPPKDSLPRESRF